MIPVFELRLPARREAGEPSEPRGTPINRLGPVDQRRITAVLQHLGWEPKRSKGERWWQPKNGRG
jgi:hypothetical protein